MSEKAFTKESLLASKGFSDSDKVLLKRVLKEDTKYTRTQAQTQLAKIKAKAVV